MELNNFNYSQSHPMSVNTNHELRNAVYLNDELSETDLTGINRSSISDSDKRLELSPTMDQPTSSTSNNFSPSPQDSPIPGDLHHEDFIDNKFFNDDKSESKNDNDKLFELTPDQLQVIRELELRKQQSDYDDDYEYGINYDDVPEYDVRAKIQSLNAQLADEPLPPEGLHRNSKVVFKEDIISLVVPPESEEGQSDSEQEDPSFSTNVSGQSPVHVESEVSYQSAVLIADGTAPSQDDSDIVSVEPEVVQVEESEVKSSEYDLPLEDSDIKHDNRDNTQEEQTYHTPVSDKSRNTNQNEGNLENENMVVSRGGEFHIMGSDDFIGNTNHVSKPANEDNDQKRTRNRPVSASVSKRNNRNQSANLDGNSSTKSEEFSRSNSLLQKQNDRSKLQVPRVDKEALRRQQERKKKEEEENQRREEEEQKMRKEMNDKSFNTWLQTKQKLRKEDEERKKKEDDEEKEKKEKLQDERKVLADEKEKELAKKMENEKRKEEKLRQYRLKEMEDSMIVHSKAECRKAFKDWLRKKHRDHQTKVKEERQRARITRLAMRQCRKSQDLAQAIQQSNSFRYLDFCGYP